MKNRPTVANPDPSDMLWDLVLVGAVGLGVYFGVKQLIPDFRWPWEQPSDPPDPGCLLQYSYRLCQIMAANPRFIENLDWYKANGGTCDWTNFRNAMAMVGNPDPGSVVPPEWSWLCPS